MSVLIGLVYTDVESGRGAFEEFKNLQKMRLISMADIALGTKDEKGKVKQTLEKRNVGADGFFSP